MLAVMNPTSPGVSLSFLTSFGVVTPISTTSYVALVSISFITSPFFNSPFTILVIMTTPRYGSKILSNINPCNGLFISPIGAGILSIIASINSLIPIPFLADVHIISSSSKPKLFINSNFTLSISAFGKSILFITGIIFRLCSIAKYKFANVCASIPCAASTTNIAPSHAARLLLTSYEKSTCPGVSIKCNM